jgi:hypothetical protein
MVYVYYWASTELLFLALLKASFDDNFQLVKFSHAPQWFEDRSILRNLIHIFRQIALNLFRKRSTTLVLFGNNLCRIYAPIFIFRRNIILVFNELPCDDQQKILFYYDRFIFKVYNRRIYVSNSERSKLTYNIYGLKEFPLILTNLPFEAYKFWIQNKNIKVCKTRSNICYFGQLTDSRFGAAERNALCKFLDYYDLTLDVYGSYYQTELLNDKRINFKGECTRDQVMQTMEKYRYGLLSYTTNDLNNDYCAPLKIYEYLAAGIIVLSVHRNTSLLSIRDNYGACVRFIDEQLLDVQQDDENDGREQFMLDAINNQFDFLHHVEDLKTK